MSEQKCVWTDEAMNYIYIKGFMLIIKMSRWHVICWCHNQNYKCLSSCKIESIGQTPAEGKRLGKIKRGSKLKWKQKDRWTTDAKNENWTGDMSFACASRKLSSAGQTLTGRKDLGISTKNHKTNITWNQSENTRMVEQTTQLNTDARIEGLDVQMKTEQATCHTEEP